MDWRNTKFPTRAIHAGEVADTFGSPHTPVYDTTTFKFGATAEMLEVIEGRRSGGLYTRYGMNPSITSVEAKLAQLEETEAALLFASGMAAISATLLAHGGRGIVSLGEIYGGTYQLMTAQLPALGIETRCLSGECPDALEPSLRQGFGLIFLETPANPTLAIVDIGRICELAHRYGALVVVDNTFATPVNQRPIVQGADLVLHSATKYLGGHSDLTGGVACGSERLLDSLRPWRKNLGQVMAPDTARLLSRSLATLAVRVERHNSSALFLAQILRSHPNLRRVLYPGLPDFPGHAVAARQMSGFGGMLAIEICGSGEDAARVADRLRIFSLAVSLGGVESLVSQPALTSHRDLGAAERAARGIGDNLLRLSVGLEDPGDLLDDLEQALSVL